MAKGSSRKNKNGLNANQQKFADRYLLNGNNAAEAYRYAYKNKRCSDQQATVNGTNILKRNANISKYINSTQERLQQAAEEKEGMTREKMIEHLTNLAFGKEVVTDVAERYKGGKMNGVMKSKTISRSWALERLIKMLGYDEPDKVQVSGNIDGTIEIDFQTVEEYLKNGKQN